MSKAISCYQLIEKKRDGHALTKEEIQWVIKGLLNGKVKKYQMTALLMAIFFQGMSDEETADLTDAMLYSGKVLEFSDPTIVDKHSTGGVGDKTSFILAPLAAACGVKVPMVAGRGLGHTGGTIDKIESLEGFKTSLGLEEFSRDLLKHKLVLIGQTEDIAPADKIIYGLRDVTATINSIPLITASIMSKKLAEGAQGLVMDIKVGNGAFMRTKTEAKKLAKSIQKTAKRFGRKSVCLLTDMNQPLGHMIGNSLEIEECIQTLKGEGPKDLENLSVELAAYMVLIAGLKPSLTAARKEVKKVLKNGLALKEFAALIERQDGNPDVVKDPRKFLPLAPIQTSILSPTTGFIRSFDTEKLGLLCVAIGGGRKAAGEVIDYSVGMNLHKKAGQKVKEGEPLLTFYHHPEQRPLIEEIEKTLVPEIIKLSKNKPVVKPLILETLI